MKRLRIGVIYGGRSSEHEVSIASAASVIANLNPSRYEPVPIRIERNGRWTLPDRESTEILENSVSNPTNILDEESTETRHEVHLVADPTDDAIIIIEREPSDHRRSSGQQTSAVERLPLDVVFPLIHGPYGEDGTLQGLLELANVPYIGAGVLSSAVSMDKAVAKILFTARGLPQVNYQIVTGNQWDMNARTIATQIAAELSYPLFVKPANLGSSIGVSKVANKSQLSLAVERAREFDEKVIVESGVPHVREIECAVLGGDTPEVSVPGEIMPSGEFYDFHAKYFDKNSKLEIPANLTSTQTESLQSLAVEAFRAVEGYGMARVDFLLSGKDGTVYLNEVNTIPGFTTASMYAKLWEASGIGFVKLLDRLVDLALTRHDRKQRLRTTLT